MSLLPLGLKPGSAGIVSIIIITNVDLIIITIVISNSSY